MLGFCLFVCVCLGFLRFFCFFFLVFQLCYPKEILVPGFNSVNADNEHSIAFKLQITSIL